LYSYINFINYRLCTWSWKISHDRNNK